MDIDTLLNIGLVLIFVLVGGIFAGTEMALVSLREGQIRRIEATGHRGRRTAELVRNPNRFLSSVQIGVTVAGFFSSAYGASTIAPDLVPVLARWGVPDAAAPTVALVGMTLCIAYLSLVLGELAPKRLAMQRAESVARLAAPALGVFARTMTPVIWLLSASTNAVVRLLGGDPRARTAAVSAEEVRVMVAESGDLSEHHRKILGDVFDAADRTVAEVMRPRGQVDFLAADTPAAEALASAARLTHSRYPVYRGDRDDVVGFVHLRDLLRAHDGASVGSLARPLIAFPGSVTVLAALARLRGEAQQLGLVVDEYGGTDGIVALEDLLEEIVGEIYDEYDLGVPPAGRSVDASGAVLVDGSLIVQELPEIAGIAVPDDGTYETVGGYVLAALGRIAAPGDRVDGPGYRIEVTAVDGLRVARVRIVTEPFPDADPSGR